MGSLRTLHHLFLHGPRLMRSERKIEWVRLPLRLDPIAQALQPVCPRPTMERPAPRAADPKENSGGPQSGPAYTLQRKRDNVEKVVQFHRAV